MDKKLEIVKNLTVELLEKLTVSAEVSVTSLEEGTVNVEITGDDSGVLIGYHGQTLNALQLVLGLMVNRALGNWERIILDVCRWRVKREEDLKETAKQIAREVATSNQARSLTGLTASERRVVHMVLAENTETVTESEGEGEERKLVIKPRTK